MKYNTRLLTLIFALIFTVLTVIFSITVSAAAKDDRKEVSSFEKLYILKDFEGRPAVFENGKVTLDAKNLDPKVKSVTVTVHNANQEIYYQVFNY